MIYRYILAGMFTLIISAVTAACGRGPDLSSLSDMGGLYYFDNKSIDFREEISGRLTEGGEQAAFRSEADASGNEADISGSEQASFGNEADASGNEPDTYAAEVSADANYNKLRRWGISRRPDNQLPGADPGAPELLAKYNGIYLGDTSKKEIYLTFDEGYENGYTPKILDILKNNGVKAVFFITGPYLKQQSVLVMRMVEEGHTVGNHTIHHPSLPDMGDKEVEEEVLGLDRVFQEKFGRSMKYLRPPKGEYSARSLDITNKLGYRNVFWSFAYDDWYRDRIRGADYAYGIVMRNLHNGAILLLHAVSKDNADALDSIIKGIRAKGYNIGNINNIN